MAGKFDVALMVAAQQLNFCKPFGPLPVMLSTAPARNPISQTPHACVLAQLIIFEIKKSKLHTRLAAQSFPRLKPKTGMKANLG